jgi:hypothetical protein
VRLFAWEDGSFEFHARVDAGAFDETPQPLAAALLDAMRIADEARRRPPRPYPPGGVFEVDDAAAGEETLAKLEASIVDLARVGMSVRKILDVVPEPDPTVLAAMDVLVDRRVMLLK